jgi:predicted ATPase
VLKIRAFGRWSLQHVPLTSAVPSKVISITRRARDHAALGSFVGREDVLDQIAAELRDRGARLITLAGPPGIGKTRTAQRFLESFVHKNHVARFCDLREVRDATGLVHAVASMWPSLESRVARNDDVEALVATHLRAAGPLLLVLDNFEQIANAAHVVRGWCQAAHELSVIVTSRSRLAVEGEVVIELLPLTCPKAGDDDADVLACEAVRLLSARAKAIGGTLGQDLTALSALVRRLDGIPLAIELAAARTRVFLPRELLDRLEQRFELVAQSSSRAHKTQQIEANRHATLTSAFDWSWHLMSAPEQRAFAECCVFADSFTIEAAERILSPSSDGTSIVDLIFALRDKSLLHVRPEGGRLAIYVSLREYAEEKLKAFGKNIFDAVRLRHAHHYASTVRTFNASRAFQTTADDAELRASLTSDRDNLVTAVETFRTLESTDLEDASALADLAIGLSLVPLAPADFCVDALALARARVDASQCADPSLTAHILIARQATLGVIGRKKDCLDDLRAALALDDVPPKLRAYALLVGGVQFRMQSHYEEAWQTHLAAERVLEQTDLPRLRATNLACMGRLQLDFGDERLGREYNERARHLYLEIGEAWMSELPRVNVAHLEQEKQNFAAAIAILERAIHRFATASEARYEALYTSVLGDVLLEEGNIEDARAKYAAAAPVLHDWHRCANLYGAWATLEAIAGDTRRAQDYFERAERTAQRSHNVAVRLIVELFEGAMRIRLAHALNGRELRREIDRWASRSRDLETNVDVLSSIDVRFARRILHQAIDACSNATSTVLIVGPNADHVSLGDQPRIDLARRTSLRRIVSALIEHHRTNPSHALGHDALIAHGWPGERLLQDAAGTRLRVAIATLRRLGLRDLIVTRDDGYLIDPKTRVTNV